MFCGCLVCCDGGYDGVSLLVGVVGLWFAINYTCWVWFCLVLRVFWFRFVVTVCLLWVCLF